MDSRESFALAKFKVAAHEQIQQPAGLAARRGEPGVAAAQDLVAQIAAVERVAAEEKRREFPNESAQRSESVLHNRLALQGRVQEVDENVE